MNDASAAPNPIGRSLSSAELVTTIAHFHRAEIARMAGWRDRLDRTTNWAITVVAAMLSVSLSTASAHHGVLLFAMLLVLLLLWIEARRYRFFDFYRARVRQLERHYFAQIFAPREDFASDWLLIVGEGLRAPKFLLSQRVALARRLRRNYAYLFLVLLLAWVLKISTPSLQAVGARPGLVGSLREVIDNAALGPIPGTVIVAFIAAFYIALFAAAFVAVGDRGELTFGDVHV
ncbi:MULTISPECIES: DUF2270 domain-containing protein [unclassified Mesorhizobium]|uniref:DUF2270 domain-containing protein n=1 Tax=unclassified Mesorhizobium TaxID=325217 RepID=UPI00086A1274|nr:MULTISPECIES: DUF2270 domain-containing protein [unclassified Mesorhizobium]MBN9253525.1 DUF2270 domain-containing protein [Mesorhizobium sp.]MBN9271725.1 DUF2270 domain-containing protein [Mesorhizobium sp.]ODT18659.1 MAG: hypothetical protein ABS57_05515 [Mesorhizobium sp. SCN 65-12]OJX82046.1 MAG: hypothetical protein BGO93_22720 [Mesorhizobium sp. 65-26]